MCTLVTNWTTTKRITLSDAFSPAQYWCGSYSCQFEMLLLESILIAKNCWCSIVSKIYHIILPMRDKVYVKSTALNCRAPILYFSSVFLKCNSQIPTSISWVAAIREMTLRLKLTPTNKPSTNQPYPLYWLDQLVLRDHTLLDLKHCFSPKIKPQSQWPNPQKIDPLLLHW